MIFKYSLHIILKIAFNGQLYRIAGCCRLSDFIGYDHSRRIPRYRAYAVISAKRAFHGALNAPFTGGIIQAVALFGKLLVFIRRYRAYPADYLRDKILAVILAYCLFYDIDTLQHKALLFELYYSLHRHIFRHCITVLIRKVAYEHLIAHTCYISSHLLTVFVGDLKLLIQRIHTVFGCSVNTEFKLGSERVYLIIVTCKLIRSCLAYRDSFYPFLFIILKYFKRFRYNVIFCAAFKKRFLNYYLIYKLIGVEHLAVFCEYLSSRRLNSLICSICVRGLVFIIFTVNYLYLQ